MAFVAPTADFEKRIRESFAKQTFMVGIGATISSVTPGEVVLDLPFRGDLTQQNDFLHAGVVTALADVACGYAATTLMPVGSDVLSVEFKINLIAPGLGERFSAVGRVLRAGRTLTTCAADVWAIHRGETTQIAAMLATMMQVTR